LFLIKLTKYLGFYTENNYEEGKSFNLLKGEFSYEAINYDQQTSTAFAQLLNSQESRILIESKEKRKDVLNLLMKYYKTHQQGMGEIKSLKVFEALA
jgi:DNA repair protein RecO (recombination protein O)